MTHYFIEATRDIHNFLRDSFLIGLNRKKLKLLFIWLKGQRRLSGFSMKKKSLHTYSQVFAPKCAHTESRVLITKLVCSYSGRNHNLFSIFLPASE